jgi:hypothetical protein
MLWRVLLLCWLVNLVGCGPDYRGQPYFMVCYPAISHQFQLLLDDKGIAFESPAVVLTVVAPAYFESASELLRQDILPTFGAVLGATATPPSPRGPRNLLNRKNQYDDWLNIGYGEDGPLCADWINPSLGVEPGTFRACAPDPRSTRPLRIGCRSEQPS